MFLRYPSENVETTRVPPRFRELVIAQFRSQENQAYLRSEVGYMADFNSSFYRFSRNDGIAYDIIAFEGEKRESLDFWECIRHLNKKFVMFARLQMEAPLNPPEPYVMRAFIADSLRPPGYENLNAPGGLYDIHEDQIDDMDDDIFNHQERTVEKVDKYGYKGRSPIRQDGVSRGGYAESNQRWRDQGQTRYMRYEEIPFWQKGGREGYELDIEETLGLGSRELDHQIRGWDMSRVRPHEGGKHYEHKRDFLNEHDDRPQRIHKTPLSGYVA